MLVYSIGSVLVETHVSWALNNSEWALIELVIVYLIDTEFLSAANVGTRYNSLIIQF